MDAQLGVSGYTQYKLDDVKWKGRALRKEKEKSASRTMHWNESKPKFQNKYIFPLVET